MIKNKSISIIGTGHLGSAFVRGLIKSGYPANLLTLSNRNTRKSEQLAKELDALSTKSNINAVKDTEIIILAVKPQFMQDVCQEIAPIIQNKNPVIVSLAGVIDIESISRWLNNNKLGVIRVMTNTPSEFCKGTSALFASPSTTAEQKLMIEALFNNVGYTFWVDQESMIDTLTAPIGCAPAYIFLFLEALQNAAISRGISAELAEKISLESIFGAAELAKKSGRSFAQLRESVTTPQGVTAYSLEKLSMDNFFDIFKKIYTDAEERIEQISQTLPT
ncbi:pyrroline-5-carboxylate reductase [Legionella longbeachae]|uniref:Pyrroline-5-carboxylate reductase n=1 Tax=Legionella longbeachae serogroup 1 (strain NSW150) TaxID=661367 RepID=D3HQQ9_LEGLN|nr:pyrroline-5-carboxylate reductase [Legionella longbeachae]VEE01745.1 pyrroline-5-carboxylate reductase [Legionella oakridgensis]HBD7396500.1 pyrroline-5-carboxylate reductase [Legionella pneumophila]ARB91923.1 pyrroline-5-carboxylate reductase [Legionella longbeachae]ARM34892.1 pyrroline-5-carboxylate reductase [Legionella longbeachae]QIN31668.1 pyrroline-5-carboxylate reductase [Legionella longbeachae]